MKHACPCLQKVINAHLCTHTSVAALVWPCNLRRVQGLLPLPLWSPRCLMFLGWRGSPLRASCEGLGAGTTSWDHELAVPAVMKRVSWLTGLLLSGLGGHRRAFLCLTNGAAQHSAEPSCYPWALPALGCSSRREKGEQCGLVGNHRPGRAPGRGARAELRQL